MRRARPWEGCKVPAFWGGHRPPCTSPLGASHWVKKGTRTIDLCRSYHARSGCPYPPFLALVIAGEGRFGGANPRPGAQIPGPHSQEQASTALKQWNVSMGGVLLSRSPVFLVGPYGSRSPPEIPWPTTPLSRFKLHYRDGSVRTCHRSCWSFFFPPPFPDPRSPFSLQHQGHPSRGGFTRASAACLSRPYHGLRCPGPAVGRPLRRQARLPSRRGSLQKGPEITPHPHAFRRHRE